MHVKEDPAKTTSYEDVVCDLDDTWCLPQSAYGDFKGVFSLFLLFWKFKVFLFKTIQIQEVGFLENGVDLNL